MTSGKWREWWINLEERAVAGSSDYWSGSQQEQLIHVIEAAPALVEIERLDKEVERLVKIISKELSENDEFGSEFVLTSILRGELLDALVEIERLKAENEELKKAAEINWHKWNYTELEESNAELTQLLAEARELIGKLLPEPFHYEECAFLEEEDEEDLCDCGYKELNQRARAFIAKMDKG